MVLASSDMSCSASIGSALPASTPLAALARGPKSLGGLLTARGFACTPSPLHPQPCTAAALEAAAAHNADIKAKWGPPPPEARGATYFWGAYTIRRYGAALTVPSKANPLPPAACTSWARHVAAVQLETAWDGVRKEAATRRRFAEALNEAVRELLHTWAPAVLHSTRET